MNLEIVIPFDSETAARAERLCDLIFWAGGRNPRGHCVLVSAPAVHQELKTKVKIAAEVAFSTVTLIEHKQGEHPVEAAAAFILKVCRFPWLFLTPDCVPLTTNWMETLMGAYEASPYRYMGAHMKPADSDNLILSKISIYPPDMLLDMSKKLNPIPMSLKTRLIQEWKFDGDHSKIRPDAVLLHGDPTGALVETLIDKAGTVIATPPVTQQPKRGRPRNTPAL